MNIRANNGFFVCAEQGGGLDRPDALIANRAVAQAWETFTRENDPDGFFHLKTYNGNYVEVVANRVRTTATAKNENTRFRLGLDGSIVCPDGRHSLRVRTDLSDPVVDATGIVPGGTFRFEN